MKPPFLPTQIFVAKIPETLKPNALIRIRVMFPTKDQIGFNIQEYGEFSQGKVILHNHVYFVPNAEVLRDAAVDGTWNSVTERSGAFPLNIGKHLEISVITKPTKFTVLVDGNYFYDFNYRYPIELGKFIFLKGPLYVSSITYEKFVSISLVCFLTNKMKYFLMFHYYFLADSTSNCPYFLGTTIPYPNIWIDSPKCWNN